MKGTGPPKKAPRRRFSLYWCTTSDHDEDWFMVASSARAAREAHEDAEGYDGGDARAEKVVALPAELVADSTWKDPENGRFSADAGWPSDALVIACGGVISEIEADAHQAEMGVVCKSVRFGDRFYRAGAIMTNVRERLAASERRADLAGARPPPDVPQLAMSSKTVPHLRVVTAGGRAAAPAVLAHCNRRGVTYYLHEGTTKTGSRRFFFAKAIGEGALAAMPEGYELHESVNGVVSARRVTPGAPVIPAADVDVVRAALAKHAHLRHCAVEVKGNAIIVHEPQNTGPGPDEMAAFARELGVPTSRLTGHFEAKRATGRLTPVMKFEPAFVGSTGQYLAFRRTCRGEGGWLPLSHGPLAMVVGKYIGHIGRESFFELM